MSTVTDAVDRIALESVSGSGSASEIVGDAQQSAAFLAQAPPVEFDTRLEYLGLCQWPGEEFPGALTLQRALRLALLARGPQQAAPGIAKVAFQRIVGPRQGRHIVAVEQAGPIAPADLAKVTAKRLEERRDIGPPPHRVEIATELVSDVFSSQRLRSSGF